MLWFNGKGAGVRGRGSVDHFNSSYRQLPKESEPPQAYPEITLSNLDALKASCFVPKAPAIVNRDISRMIPCRNPAEAE